MAIKYREIPSATESTLVLNSLQSYESGFYTCILTNDCGTVTTTAAELAVLNGEEYCEIYVSTFQELFDVSGITGTKDIILCPGTYTMTDSLTVPSTKTLRFLRGAVISTTGYTFACNGIIDAGSKQQIFSGTGTVTLKETVNPFWFGATGNGTTDDTDAVKAAAASLGVNPGRIHFPSGTYLITDTLLISNSRVILEGEGAQVSKFKFNPTSSKSLIKIEDTGNILFQNVIKGLGFAISASCSYACTAIEAIDTSLLIIQDIGMYPWRKNGDSIGIKLCGRESTTIEKVHISADICINISKNPNSIIDCDHLHIEDGYLSASVGCILVDTDVFLTNLVIDGSNPWVGGTYGFYWDSTSSYASLNLAFNNIRREQASDDTSYCFYINRTGNIYNIIYDNVYISSQKGFYLRGCNSISFRNVFYVGIEGVTGEETINADSTNDMLLFDNCYFLADSIAILTGLQKKFSIYKNASGSPIPNFAYYTKSAYTTTGTDVITLTNKGTTGGLTRKLKEATASITASSSITISTNAPTGARILGVQLRVDEALAAGETWDAAYGNGLGDLSIATNQAVAANTKVNAIFNPYSASPISTNGVNVVITKYGGGSFTAQGVIRAIVYYEQMETMDSL